MSHKTLIVSSANVTGNDKSQVKYRFSPPLVIPKNAVNPYVEVLSSQIWWNSPNINSTNNTLNFTLGGIARQWVADTGLYSVDDIRIAPLSMLLDKMSSDQIKEALSFSTFSPDGRPIIRTNVVKPRQIPRNTHRFVLDDKGNRIYIG